MIDGLDVLMRDLGSLMGIESTIVNEGVLDQAAQKVEDTARSFLGQYQPQMGPYQAWPLLSPETIARRTTAAKIDPSITPDDPLLMTGTMSSELTHSVEDGGLSALIGLPAGSASGVYGAVQELGSLVKSIPARPWLEPAAYVNSLEIATLFMDRIGSVFRPTGPVFT